MDLVKHDGNCAERDMIKFIKKLFEPKVVYPILEGKYADSYTDPEAIKIIKENYTKRWVPDPNPYTHPALFDPLNPPNGWRYDPFYETWVKIDE